MQVWALIVDSFRDAIDRKIFWIMVVISVAIAASMACISFDEKGINFLFGTWKITTPAWAYGSAQGRANATALVIKLIADLYIGWIGIVLALIATASTFPSLLESGAIDVVLSKPLSRHKLFLGKYLGAMVFVLVHAVIFVVLTFLVIGTRWHYWLWGYLWLIPLVVLLFSYVFAFCALFGVLTRSTMTALLLTVLAWIGIWVPQTAHGVFKAFEDQIDSGQKWERIFAAAKWAVPKTQDIPIIAGNLVNAGLVVEMFRPDKPLPEQQKQDFQRARRLERDETEAVDAFASIGSSLLCEAVVVFLALWQFKRKDF